MGDKRVTDRCYNNLCMRFGKKELDMIRLQVIEAFLESNIFNPKTSQKLHKLCF